MEAHRDDVVARQSSECELRRECMGAHRHVDASAGSSSVQDGLEHLHVLASRPNRENHCTHAPAVRFWLQAIAPLLMQRPGWHARPALGPRCEQRKTS